MSPPKPNRPEFPTQSYQLPPLHVHPAVAPRAGRTLASFLFRRERVFSKPRTPQSHLLDPRIQALIFISRNPPCLQPTPHYPIMGNTSRHSHKSNLKCDHNSNPLLTLSLALTLVLNLTKNLNSKHHSFYLS